MDFPPEVKEKSIDELKKDIDEKENKLNQLKSTLGKIKKIGLLLESIPKVIPRGMWFSHFSLKMMGKI